MTGPDGRLDSFVVSFYGLEGIKRQHWIPGNRRRGLGIREKRHYHTQEEALARSAHVNPGARAYQCGVCGFWHATSRKRRT